MEPQKFETLLTFFKALANESRLKIVGILANRACTVGELAALLDLKEPTISQHLFLLKEAGLVEVRAEGNHRWYSFNLRALIDMSKEVFSREKLASLVGSMEEVEDDYERKVFKTFLQGEKIVQFPAAEKKWRVVLRWLASKFEEGVRYPEKQVNEILRRHHEDFATMRRDLVDNGFMQREKGIYWRVPAKDEARTG